MEMFDEVSYLNDFHSLIILLGEIVVQASTGYLRLLF